MEKSYEHCIRCNAETGKAGACEDSVFLADNGPYCDECYDAYITEIRDQCGFNDELNALRADLATRDAEIERLRENDIAAALEALSKHPKAECVCLEPPVECECCYDDGWKCFFDATGGYRTGKTAIEAVNNARAVLGGGEGE